MNIIITGPQASGKGTQAKLLAKEFNLFHMENGKVLRKMAEKDEGIRDMVNEGILVPDQEMLGIMEEHIGENHGKIDNIVFDGYPRTVSQYGVLKGWLKSKGTQVDYAVVLEIGREESIKRLSARRIYKSTGEVFNLITKPPVGIPEDELVQREDDKPDAINKRLAVYEEKTRPLVDYYKRDGVLIRIDGERSIEEISKDIIIKIKKLSKPAR